MHARLIARPGKKGLTLIAKLVLDIVGQVFNLSGQDAIRPYSQSARARPPGDARIERGCRGLSGLLRIQKDRFRVANGRTACRRSFRCLEDAI